MTSNISNQKLKEQLSRIQILNKQRRYKIDSAATAVFCQAVLREMEMTENSMSVAFVSEDAIKKLNETYLRRNYPTDVLCFAYNEVMENGKHFLGEIIIAPLVSIRNALRYRIQPEKEIRKLLVHGILHLIGYDHVTDDGAMHRQQRRLMRRVFFEKGTPVLKN